LQKESSSKQKKQGAKAKSQTRTEEKSGEERGGQLEQQMSLQSAAMYLQNSIAAVGMQTQNLANYQLLYSDLLSSDLPDQQDLLNKFPGL